MDLGISNILQYWNQPIYSCEVDMEPEIHSNGETYVPKAKITIERHDVNAIIVQDTNDPSLKYCSYYKPIKFVCYGYHSEIVEVSHGGDLYETRTDGKHRLYTNFGDSVREAELIYASLVRLYGSDRVIKNYDPTYNIEPMEFDEGSRIIDSFPDIVTWEAPFYTCILRAYNQKDVNFKYPFRIYIEKFFLYEIIISMRSETIDGKNYYKQVIKFSLKNKCGDSVTVEIDKNSNNGKYISFTPSSQYWYSRFYTNINDAIQEAECMKENIINGSRFKIPIICKPRKDSNQ